MSIHDGEGFDFYDFACDANELLFVELFYDLLHKVHKEDLDATCDFEVRFDLKSKISIIFPGVFYYFVQEHEDSGGFLIEASIHSFISAQVRGSKWDAL